MKKILIIPILFLFTLSVYCQNTNFFSVEIDANYLHYFYNTDNNSDFKYGQASSTIDYGFSLLFANYFNKLKLSTGINYSTKSFYYEENVDNTLLHGDFKLDYINIPIIGSYEVMSKKGYFINVFTGLLFNNIYDYGIIYYDKSNENSNLILKNNLTSLKRLGITFLIGPNFSKSIWKNFKLNLSPTMYYKLRLDSNDKFNDYVVPKRFIPNNRFYFGIKIGIEYLKAYPN